MYLLQRYKKTSEQQKKTVFFSLVAEEARPWWLSYEQFQIVKRAIFYHSNNSLPI